MIYTRLRAVMAAQRPPEIGNIGSGSDWKFETRALAADFEKVEVTALASDRPTISIFGYIGDDGDGGGISTSRIAGALRSVAGKPITVEINSPGGNYFEGVAAYNLLRRHDAPVRVEVVGIAASAASVIAMAGDEIAIAANAEIMIHEARGLFLGTKSEMRDAWETLAHVDTAMCETYAARSGRPVAEFEALIAGKDVYFRGQEAIDAGLADVLMERQAEMPVYAKATKFPSDKESLDTFLAKLDMPRSERRDLYRAMGTRNAADPATPRAGDEPEADLSRLFAALTV
ncbi:head maturation protease, ClpP-related [Sphingomonas arantia]|uniref:ATP-dependent Clp protease proteolytic subunit n=1 Tax=Sphingomonas arantia TaxID=1460676 RepID=A0ABW4TZG2_9SPHN